MYIHPYTLNVYMHPYTLNIYYVYIHFIYYGYIHAYNHIHTYIPTIHAVVSGEQ